MNPATEKWICAAVDYAPLTQATRGNAQYCYDIATLLPVYNPIATTIVANSTGMAGNAISTVAVFGAAYGTIPNAVTYCTAPLFLALLYATSNLRPHILPPFQLPCLICPSHW